MNIKILTYSKYHIRKKNNNKSVTVREVDENQKKLRMRM